MYHTTTNYKGSFLLFLGTLSLLSTLLLRARKSTFDTPFFMLKTCHTSNKILIQRHVHIFLTENSKISLLDWQWDNSLTGKSVFFYTYTQTGQRVVLLSVQWTINRKTVSKFNYICFFLSFSLVISSKFRVVLLSVQWAWYGVEKFGG